MTKAWISMMVLLERFDEANDFWGGITARATLKARRQLFDLA
jgi:hypothetical protein